jgi:hypothetical protein
MTKQTRRMSFVESLSNLFLGFCLSLIINHYGMKFLFGYTLPLMGNLILVIIFSLVSIIRSYGIRRVFEYLKDINHGGI